MVCPVSWMIWLFGALVLVTAGFATAYLPRRRARELRRRTAWSTARSAIGSAGVSRDASPAPVPAADDLLHRAELLVAAGGGTDAAEEAAGCAQRADRLWREAAGE